MYINAYTEILILPKELRNLQIEADCDKGELERYCRWFTAGGQLKTSTVVKEKCKKYPLVSFRELKEFGEDNVVRVQGFVVRFGFNKRILIGLWSGKGEDEVIELVVPNETAVWFLNQKNWEEIKRDVISHEKLFHAVVKIGKGEYKVIHTQLIR